MMLRPFEESLSKGLNTVAQKQLGENVTLEFAFVKFDYQSWLPTANMLNEGLSGRKPAG